MAEHVYSFSERVVRRRRLSIRLGVEIGEESGPYSQRPALQDAADRLRLCSRGEMCLEPSWPPNGNGKPWVSCAGCGLECLGFAGLNRHARLARRQLREAYRG